MENNNQNLTNQNNGNQPVKKTYSAGLTVGILSIPCGLLIAISGWILGIVGIVINNSTLGAAMGSTNGPVRLSRRHKPSPKEILK